MFYLKKGFNALRSKSRILQKLQFQIKIKQPVYSFGFNFCDLNRLHIQKYLETKPAEKEIKLEKSASQPFNKEDFVIEFSSELDWETSVMKSEIPVVVDCYAE